jgi:hypothetical protein
MTIGTQCCNTISRSDSLVNKQAGKPLRFVPKFLIRELLIIINDGGRIGERGRSAIEKGYRAEWASRHMSLSSW